MFIQLLIALVLMAVVSGMNAISLADSLPSCCFCGTATVEGLPSLPFGACGCANKDFVVKTTAISDVLLTSIIETKLKVTFED